MPEALNSMGDFMLLVTYWNRLSSPLRELERLGGKIIEQISESEDIVTVLKRASLVQDLPDARPMSSDSIADVHLAGVSFTYPDRTTDTLRQLSVSFSRGQTTAIVGPSGAGKSTILKLILRMYDPSTIGRWRDGLYNGKWTRRCRPIFSFYDKLKKGELIPFDIGYLEERSSRVYTTALNRLEHYTGIGFIKPKLKLIAEKAITQPSIKSSIITNKK